MATTQFRWIKPPETLTRAYEEYGRRVLAAVHAVAVYTGQRMQDAARMGAPWQDRTGNARGGLFFAVDGLGLPAVVGKVDAGVSKVGMGEATITESGDGTHLILTLGHTMYYGKYLETAHGGRYAIVMSTIEGHLPELEKMLKDLFGGGVGATAGGYVSVV